MKTRKLYLIGILSIIFFGIINIGCDGGNNKSDEYYVKYEVNSSTMYGPKINVTITNESKSNLTIVVNANKPWETIIGPVQKGFNARLTVNSEPVPLGVVTLYVQISVSKNNSPFSLKKIDTQINYVQINYNIDY